MNTEPKPEHAPESFELDPLAHDLDDPFAGLMDLVVPLGGVPATQSREPLPRAPRPSEIKVLAADHAADELHPLTLELDGLEDDGANGIADSFAASFGRVLPPPPPPPEPERRIVAGTATLGKLSITQRLAGTKPGRAWSNLFEGTLGWRRAPTDARYVRRKMALRYAIFVAGASLVTLIAATPGVGAAYRHSTPDAAASASRWSRGVAAYPPIEVPESLPDGTIVATRTVREARGLYEALEGAIVAAGRTGDPVPIEAFATPTLAGVLADQARALHAQGRCEEIGGSANAFTFTGGYPGRTPTSLQAEVPLVTVRLRPIAGAPKISDPAQTYSRVDVSFQQTEAGWRVSALRFVP